MWVKDILSPFHSLRNCQWRGWGRLVGGGGGGGGEGVIFFFIFKEKEMTKFLCLNLCHKPAKWQGLWCEMRDYAWCWLVFSGLQQETVYVTVLKGPFIYYLIKVMWFREMDGNQNTEQRSKGKGKTWQIISYIWTLPPSLGKMLGKKQSEGGLFPDNSLEKMWIEVQWLHEHRTLQRLICRPKKKQIR